MAFAIFLLSAHAAARGASLARSSSALRASALRMSTATLPTAKPEGELGTEEFKVNFVEGSEPRSPWHDVPLEAGNGLYNFVNEIPKYTTAKMEVDTKAANNPIVQDEKKGKLRYYHGCIFWNYGCLPQTWEDPNVKGSEEVGGAFGDNDPIDVVEIGSQRLEMGSITPVKPLGVLAMIDDGELDWKVIAIAATDPMAAELNDVADLEAKMPGVVSGIREWFRWYKTPDDKPLNAFGYGEKCLGAAKAKEVIAETHGFYKALLEGKTEKGKLWLPN